MPLHGPASSVVCLDTLCSTHHSRTNPPQRGACGPHTAVVAAEESACPSAGGSASPRGSIQCAADSRTSLGSCAFPSSSLLLPRLLSANSTTCLPHSNGMAQLKSALPSYDPLELPRRVCPSMWPITSLCYMRDVQGRSPLFYGHVRLAKQPLCKINSHARSSQSSGCRISFLFMYFCSPATLL